MTSLRDEHITTPLAAGPTPRRIIIDTDCGVDDAVGLIAALQLAPQVGQRVALITTSFGNCSLNDVVRNVAKCVKMAGGDASQVEIATGAHGPLCGKPIDASYFHGMDGLGDVDSSSVGFCPLTSEEEEAVQRNLERPASAAILNVCSNSLEEMEEKEGQEREGGVTIITLGPLTNLALALRADSAGVIKRACRKLVIMGGCDNARGNVTRCAEFNVFADPEAAAEVFSEVQSWGEGCEVVVVSWNLCVNNPLPWHRFDSALPAAGSRDGRTSAHNTLPTLREFLRAICYKAYIHDRETLSVEKSGAESGEKRAGAGAVICDALAVCIALYPEVAIQSSKVHVEVELSGVHTRGMTVTCNNHCYDSVERERNVSWIDSVDVHRFCELFEAALHE